MSLSTLKHVSYFQFLDICVQIQADEANFQSWELFNFDFQNFRVFEEKVSTLKIELTQAATQTHFLLPFVMTSKWTTFGWFQERLVHYADGSFCYRRKNDKQIIAQVNGQSPERAREIAYYFLLSTVGELLEKRGYFRLHAAALRKKDQNLTTLLFGLSGSGKSSLALQAMQDETMEVLSDEMLLYKEGILYSIPLNITVSEMILNQLSLTSEKTFYHSEYQKKKFVFPLPPSKLISFAKLDQIFLLDSDNQQWSSHEISLFEKSAFIIKLVLGLHLPQMTQYFVRADNFFFIIILAFRRLFLALHLLKYPLLDFRTGPDLRKNYSALLKVIRSV